METNAPLTDVNSPDEPEAPAESAFSQSEPIPGYFTRERIGTGGYGEVWKADAPGGLSKAIKFVYGNMDDARATREMRSLNRIKEVHHPFLLSLERIEVIDGHLVIVTELADQNLKELFDQYRQQGQDGIPRDELLSYLREAADALDFLFEEHSLQHLDVKPENLLLVGKHVKVGDFGLLKDLHETSASLMGGMTPLYSPPEVFDGRPNQHSDQYSLAIVFQEMLTGEPPFGGRTTAQLAAQHLHSRPMLASLPPADRPIVARALSKNPEHRFSGCRELIENLLNPPSGPGALAPRRESKLAKPSVPVARTAVMGSGIEASAVADGRTVILTPPEVRTLPPIELTTHEESELAPTLFIGVGGTAAKALCRLRRRLRDRFGNLEKVPAIQLMLIDTDVQTISQATKGDSPSVMADRETVAMPLRQAQEYRAESKDLLAWMSRRWLYNIPRSLKTEGLRPLGRLALVDHHEKLTARLRAAIELATNAERIAETSQNTGMTFQVGPPRICFVSSVSGGTGSGMVLDLAYLVRHVCTEFGFDRVETTGVLTHSTSRKASERDLAVANAYACLTELRHFSLSGGCYPGDPACQLPPVYDHHAPFSHAYLTHLGDELDDEQYLAATDSLAEYLYRSTVTKASLFFQKCREADNDGDQIGRETQLRTFGLCQLGGSNSDVPRVEADLLCRTLVRKWRGEAAEEVQPLKLSQLNSQVVANDVKEKKIDPRIADLGANMVRDMQLQTDAIVEQIQAIVAEEMGSSPEDYFQSFLADLLKDPGSISQNDESAPPANAVLDMFDAVLGTREFEDERRRPRFESLQTTLESHLRQLAKQKGKSLGEMLLRLIDVAGLRVHGASQAAEWFTEYFKVVEETTTRRKPVLREKVLAVKESLREWQMGRSSKANKEANERFLKYAALQLEDVVLQGVWKYVRTVQSHVTASSDQIQEFRKDLNQLADQFCIESSKDPSKTGSSSHKKWSSVSQALRSRKDELVAALDREMEQRFFRDGGRLRRVLADGEEVRSTLTTALRAAARTVILRTMKDVNAAYIVDLTNSDPVQQIRTIREHLAKARPELMSCGGAKRLLLVLPEGAEQLDLQDSIRQESSDTPTIIFDSDGDIVLCYEIEQLPLSHVAGSLIANRADYAQIAGRLHTRLDVDWTAI